MMASIFRMRMILLPFSMRRADGAAAIGTMSRGRNRKARRRTAHPVVDRTPRRALHFALLDVALCRVSPRGGAGNADNARRGRLACFLPLRRVKAPRLARRKGTPMDVLYLGLTVGFFLVSWAFVVACDRLS
jgi:hypothetical protein